MIPNPNAPQPMRPILEPAERAKLAVALNELIASWPATNDVGMPITHITEREIAHRLRKAPPVGVDPEAIDVEAVRDALRGRNAGRAP